MVEYADPGTTLILSPLAQESHPIGTPASVSTATLEISVKTVSIK